MSISTVGTSRSTLLAAAHAEWTRQAERKSALTGERAQTVPPDSVLIATDSVLRAEIEAADSSSTSSSGSGGGAPMGGGSVGGSASSSDMHITTSTTSSDTADSGTGSTADATTNATADAATYGVSGAVASSSVKSGRLVDTLA